MLLLMTAPIYGWLLRIFTFWRFLSSFGVHVAAESQLICSHQPIVALAGDDVILPCHLEPPISASSEKVLWTKPGLDPKYIHFHQVSRLMYHRQNPSYKYRTRLFVDELMNGNVSLKISNVKISDAGKYFCITDSKQKEASINLTVGAVSTPIIKLVSNNSAEVVLQCESAGWYPEPEVFWLDGEGNLLSAGPTKTDRRPDDLYNVSSRVTVEIEHSSSFTCRVHQKDINQTRETNTYFLVPADVIMIQTFLCLSTVITFCALLILMIKSGSFTVHYFLYWFQGISAVIVIVALGSMTTLIMNYDPYMKSFHWIWWIAIAFYIVAILINIFTLIMNCAFFTVNWSSYFAWIVSVFLVTISLMSMSLLITNYYLYMKAGRWIWWITIVFNIIDLMLAIFTLIMNSGSFPANFSLNWFRGITVVIVFVALASIISLVIYHDLYMKSLPWIWWIVNSLNIAAMLFSIFTLVKSFKNKVGTVSPKLSTQLENVEAIRKDGASADQQIELQEVETKVCAQEDEIQAVTPELSILTGQKREPENQEATGEDGASADQQGELQEEKMMDCEHLGSVEGRTNKHDMKGRETTEKQN